MQMRTVGKKTSQLLSIPETQAPAPDELLEIITCKCTEGCTATSGFQRLGLEYSAICRNCTDRWLNPALIELEEEDSEDAELEKYNIDEGNEEDASENEDVYLQDLWIQTAKSMNLHQEDDLQDLLPL